MRSNFPCHGCWWSEGGRCYNAKLGLGEPPRNAPIFSGLNGFEQNDAHLAICADTDRGRKPREEVIGPFLQRLKDDGFTVVRASPPFQYPAIQKGE